MPCSSGLRSRMPASRPSTSPMSCSTRWRISPRRIRWKRWRYSATASPGAAMCWPRSTSDSGRLALRASMRHCAMSSSDSGSTSTRKPSTEGNASASSPKRRRSPLCWRPSGEPLAKTTPSGTMASSCSTTPSSWRRLISVRSNSCRARSRSITAQCGRWRGGRVGALQRLPPGTSDRAGVTGAGDLPSPRDAASGHKATPCAPLRSRTPLKPVGWARPPRTSSGRRAQLRHAVGQRGGQRGAARHLTRLAQVADRAALAHHQVGVAGRAAEEVQIVRTTACTGPGATA